MTHPDRSGCARTRARSVHELRPLHPAGVRLAKPKRRQWRHRRGHRDRRVHTLREDVEVIEAQQRVMLENPGLRAVPINADRAVIAVHKVLERLHAEQAAHHRVAAS